MKTVRDVGAAFALIAGFAPVISLAQGLPGGASTLNETHGDWTVACVAPEGNVQCAISQSQVSGQNGQRVLTIELRAAESGAVANGTLVLPFGLKLDDGVRLALDEAAPFQTLRFSTCMPTGCLIPLAFDEKSVVGLQSGNTLSLASVASDSGKDIIFSVSLRGFTSAFAQTVALNGN